MLWELKITRNKRGANFNDILVATLDEIGIRFLLFYYGCCKIFNVWYWFIFATRILHKKFFFEYLLCEHFTLFSHLKVYIHTKKIHIGKLSGLRSFKFLYFLPGNCKKIVRLFGLFFQDLRVMAKFFIKKAQRWNRLRRSCNDAIKLILYGNFKDEVYRSRFWSVVCKGLKFLNLLSFFRQVFPKFIYLFF